MSVRPVRFWQQLLRVSLLLLTSLSTAYFRGRFNYSLGTTDLREYQFYFDGKRLDEGAAAELFKDDMRGNIIHPDALFERDYVFKQFHAEKQDFSPYCDVSTDPSIDDFDCSDYTFTGGIFK